MFHKFILSSLFDPSARSSKVHQSPGHIEGPTMRGTTLFVAASLLSMVLSVNPAITHAEEEHPEEPPPEQAPPCDFLTGGGFIVRPNQAKANFGVGGGCKHGSPTWGHLNYVDHGNAPEPAVMPPPFHVHWTSITAYLFIDDLGPDPRTGQPRGTRQICGTASTNHPQYPEVDFRVQATDRGEPGRLDEFIIRLGVAGAIIYTTEADMDRTLGNAGPGGGNIQLHKPNPSTTGAFGGECRI